MTESIANMAAPLVAEDHLPLAEHQLAAERCFTKFDDGKIRFCGLNAFRHLRKAWVIRKTDPEMATFRAITAEEEAASALMLALQQKRYPKSRYLNHRDHVHKAAITPFLRAVARVMAGIEFVKPIVSLNEHVEPPTVHVKFNMQNVGAELSEPLYGHPDQPFNFSIRQGSNQGPVHMFDEELKEVAKGRGVEAIVKLMKEEANFRNRLLYAADAGVPHVEVEDGFFLERVGRVTTLLTLTIGINQTSMHQLFVVQCLHAFLRALAKIDEAEIEFPDFEHAKGASISITKLDEGEPEAWINLNWSATIPFTYTFGAAGVWRVPTGSA
jgi:hypothetical protein